MPRNKLKLLRMALVSMLVTVRSLGTLGIKSGPKELKRLQIQTVQSREILARAVASIIPLGASGTGEPKSPRLTVRAMVELGTASNGSVMRVRLGQLDGVLLIAERYLVHLKILHKGNSRITQGPLNGSCSMYPGQLST